jgi:hypothetical protein
MLAGQLLVAIRTSVEGNILARISFLHAKRMRG